MVLLDTAPDDWDVYTGIETFTFATESLNVQKASVALRKSDSLQAKPLVVVEAGDDSDVQSAWASGKSDFQAYWYSRQRALARNSTNSIFVVAVKSGHTIPQDEPQLTLETIKLVIKAVKNHSKLRACTKTNLRRLGGVCAKG